MDKNHKNEHRAEASISGGSSARYLTNDPSITELLLSHGLKLRDLILLLFLSDQGPLSIEQLAQMMSTGPRDLLNAVKRLAAEGLVIRDPISPDPFSDTTIRLTDRGQEIAIRINAES